MSTNNAESYIRPVEIIIAETVENIYNTVMKNYVQINLSATVTQYFNVVCTNVCSLLPIVIYGYITINLARKNQISSEEHLI